MTLGKAIKLCRTQRGISQAELAAAAGISVSYVSLLERGKRDLTMSTLEQIAAALNMPVLLLVSLADGKLTSIAPDVAEKLSHAALERLKDSGH